MVEKMELLKENVELTGPRAADSSLLFVCKALFTPLVAAGCLGLTLLFWHVPLSGPHFLLMVLTFLATAYLLDDVQPNPHAARRENSWLRATLDTVLRWIFVVMFLWIVFYSAGMNTLLDQRVLVMWAVITPFIIVFGRMVVSHLMIDYGRRHVQLRKAVIVGVTDLGLRLQQQFRSDPFLGIEVSGFFEARNQERLPDNHSANIIGQPTDLARYILEHDIQLVYITLPMTSHPRILELLDSLKNSTASVYFVPDLFVFDLIQARFDMVNGIPLVAVCESPFFGLRAIVKRLSDIIVAGIILLAIWPILLAIAIGVARGSPGPILFKQRRYGLDGKEILVYKFRSMTVCEDGNSIQQAQKNDARVTPFGAFLRKTSLDELPQLINVLQGRMSIVGPRPHAVAHNELYRTLIKGYMVRHKVKPGITGLAQVSGCRGETDTVDKMQARIHYDIEYLRNWSLGLDLRILLKTLTVVAGDKHAY
jgi:putative colanic acid biosynthesis UDP-glucose lipid carrier transferase